MLSNSLRILSFASLALTSFGCAAVQSSAAPKTPATAIEQTSSDQAVAGYVSPMESVVAATVPEAAEQPAAENEGVLSAGRVRASLREPLFHGEHKVVADANANGPFAPDLVQRIMSPGLRLSQMCYQNGLRRDPNLAGSMTIVLTVGATGKVWMVKATKDSEIRDPHVVSCIESSFYMLSFPRQEESVVQVTYPLVFRGRS